MGQSLPVTPGLGPQGPPALPRTGQALELLFGALSSHSQEEAVPHPDCPHAITSISDTLFQMDDQGHRQRI